MFRLRVTLCIYLSACAKSFLTSWMTNTPSRGIDCKANFNHEPSTSKDSQSHQDIYGPLGKTIDLYFLQIFRSRLSEALGVDSDLPKDDYQGIVELCAAMNARYSNRTQVQNVAQQVLVSIFPPWLSNFYSKYFSKPFPRFSSRLNAHAALIVGTWLMGNCTVNDIETDESGKIGYGQGLFVKRCRFLEASQCASTCMNACKIPTQDFFRDSMGLPLTITPDYESFECQFSFGQKPDPHREAELMTTPCLARCPTGGTTRQWHSSINCSSS
mmetsp:Transcript_28895/g.43637  ORF Transcript_28895/g.43637 Transcript_28895/m.43637 type:complete len:271 (+) Transcript_28895:238-1050(+)